MDAIMIRCPECGYQYDECECVDDIPADRAPVDELIEQQIQSQGISAIAVKDGHVFTFTHTVIEQLLAKALESGTGRVVLFVRRGLQS